MSDKRAVEALAQLLYDKSDLIGVPWSQRLPVIRDPWLGVARTQLAQARIAQVAQARIAQVDQARIAQVAQARIAQPPPVSTARAAGALPAAEWVVLGVYRKHGMGARPLSLGTLTQETTLEPGVLVNSLFTLIERGLIGEMDVFSGFSSQPVFRVLAAGMPFLPDESGVGAVSVSA